MSLNNKLVKAVAIFLIIFGLGDLLVQAGGFFIKYDSFSIILWKSFLFAAFWHDIIGGILCLLAGIGLLKRTKWGFKLSLIMAAGYANLLAYLSLMLGHYHGRFPNMFIIIPENMQTYAFYLLFILSLISTAILWKVNEYIE